MNISATVLYRDSAGRHKLEDLFGERFDSTDPTTWGLPADCRILLVMHLASYHKAWVNGELQVK